MGTNLLRRALPLTVALAVAPLATGATAAASAQPITPAEIAAAGARSATTPSRYEMFIEFEGIPIDLDSEAPLATGEIVGTNSHVVMDLESMLGPLAGDALGGVDLTMEMIVLDKALFLRAPMFGAIAEMGGEVSGAMGDLAALGDGWGRVDIGALDAGAAELSGALGAPGGDATGYYAALASATDLTPLADEVIRGVSARGVRVAVNYGEVLAAQGTDLESLPADQAAALTNMTIPFDIWIGDDGFIYRLQFVMDSDTMATAAAAAGEDPDELTDLGIGMTMTMESFDFGDPSIVIAAPAESIDITAAFEELLASS